MCTHTCHSYCPFTLMAMVAVVVAVVVVVAVAVAVLGLLEGRNKYG